ncbi:MAG TPA: hypothetical protein VHF58_07315 [Solirubrobacterales bacterium]|nr:hypothetical protein [Solirubrobacterales bacterium]
MRIAHFTLTELPGTLSIWVAGIALGAAALSRDLRRLAVPLVLMAAIALVSMLGDRAGWPETVRVALDLAFLALAGGCAWWLVGPAVRRAA